MQRMECKGAHGSGRGASVVGHNSKIPLAGLVWQSLLPPPQFGMPDEPMRLAPINTTTVPRCKLNGMNHAKNFVLQLTGDHGRKDTLEDARWYERHSDFEE